MLALHKPSIGGDAGHACAAPGRTQINPARSSQLRYTALSFNQKVTQLVDDVSLACFLHHSPPIYNTYQQGWLDAEAKPPGAGKDGGEGGLGHDVGHPPYR